MNKGAALAKAGPPTGGAVATSQYLKVAYSSKRYYRLMALARELGCSWQSIALVAIDELLDRDIPLQNQQ